MNVIEQLRNQTLQRAGIIKESSHLSNKPDIFQAYSKGPKEQ